MNFKKSSGGRGSNYLGIPGDVNGSNCMNHHLCFNKEEDEFLKNCKRELEELRNTF
jgi:hypothetical protein